MRLCLISSSYPRFPEESINGGVFVRDFALGLRDRGHEVTIFTPAKGVPMVADPGLTIHEFPWWGKETALTRLSPYHPAQFLRLASLWVRGSREIVSWGKSQRFDRALACWAIPSGWFGLQLKKKAGVPLDVWILGSDIWERHRYPLGNRIVTQVLKKADRVFADGNSLIQVGQALSGRRIDLLHSTRRLPDAPSPALNPHAVKFLFVGRHDSVKGIDVFVKALLRLAPDPKIEAHIFGEGPYSDMVRAEAKTSPQHRIHFHGSAPPTVVAGYFRTCDFLVIPSRKESLPVVFSEAMQSGLPVIASDVGDLRSFIEPHKVGMTVPPENPEALSQAMLQATKKGKKEWSQACYQLALQFDRSTIVEQYLSGI